MAIKTALSACCCFVGWLIANNNRTYSTDRWLRWSSMLFFAVFGVCARPGRLFPRFGSNMIACWRCHNESVSGRTHTTVPILPVFESGVRVPARVMNLSTSKSSLTLQYSIAWFDSFHLPCSQHDNITLLRESSTTQNYWSETACSTTGVCWVFANSICLSAAREFKGHSNKNHTVLLQA